MTSAFGPPLPRRQRLEIWCPSLVFKSSAVRDLLLVLFLDLVNLSHLQLVSLDVARSSVLITLVIADVLLEVDDEASCDFDFLQLRDVVFVNHAGRLGRCMGEALVSHLKKHIDFVVEMV